MASDGPRPSPGVIRPDELYTLAELKRRLGIKERSWWDLKKRGLRIVRAGCKTYVLGRHVIELFERLAEEQAGAASHVAEKKAPEGQQAAVAEEDVGRGGAVYECAVQQCH